MGNCQVGDCRVGGSWRPLRRRHAGRVPPANKRPNPPRALVASPHLRSRLSTPRPKEPPTRGRPRPNRPPRHQAEPVPRGAGGGSMSTWRRADRRRALCVATSRPRGVSQSLPRGSSACSHPAPSAEEAEELPPAAARAVVRAASRMLCRMSTTRPSRIASRIASRRASVAAITGARAMV